MEDFSVFAEKARNFVENTPGRAHTGFRPARDPLEFDPVTGERLFERVIMDLDTGEFSVQALSGPESGAVKTYFLLGGTREDRWKFFLDQFA
jgi:hypothetical protein